MALNETSDEFVQRCLVALEFCAGVRSEQLAGKSLTVLVENVQRARIELRDIVAALRRTNSADFQELADAWQLIIDAIERELPSCGR